MNLHYEEEQEYKVFSKEFNKLCKNNQIKFMLEIKINLPFTILNFEYALNKNTNDSKKKY